MQHRSAIDGLRAVAVVPVILFHANPALLPGGFVGVDVFFVISGYLIAGLLLEELQATSRIDIARFYERRARRILPALFVVLAVTAIVGLLVLMPEALRDLGRQIAYTALFVSNLLSVEHGYFDPANDLRPLFHTWSLSVEEQFYLVFPLALILMHRLAGRHLLVSLVVAAAAFLTLSSVMGASDADGNFYSSLSRAWELLAGAACAAMARPAQRPWLAVVGLGAVLLSFFIFDGSTPWPVLPALLPVAGVVLVLLHGTESGPVNRVLSVGPVVAVGLISYSAYLIHQPLFAFARVLGVAGPWVMSALSVLTLALAGLSYRYVETPWRRRTSLAGPVRARLLAGCAIILVGFAVTGATFDWSRGLVGRFPSNVAAVLEVHNEKQLECRDAKPVNGLGCLYGPAATAQVAILGDSHASAIAMGLAKGLARRGNGLIAATENSCAPVLGADRLEERGSVKGCAASFERRLEALAAHPEIEVVILASRWAQWTELTGFDNGEGGAEAPGQLVPTLDGVPYRQTSAVYREALRKALVRTVNRIEQMGKHVAIVGPVPEAGWDVPERLARMVMGGNGTRPLSTSAGRVGARLGHARALVAAAGALSFDPVPLFCTSRCLNEANGMPLYRDDDHVSLAGSQMIAAGLIDKLVSVGWL